MPVVSEAQRRAMYAAKSGHSTLGIPQKVGSDFIAATPKGAKLPERKAAGGMVKKKVVDHGDHFKVHSADGSQFTIAKRGLHPSTVKHIQKMAEGGEAEADDSDVSESYDPANDATTMRHSVTYDPSKDKSPPKDVAELQRAAAEANAPGPGVDPRTGMGPGVDMPGQEAAPEGSATEPEPGTGSFIGKTADTSNKLPPPDATAQAEAPGSEAVKLGKFVAAKVHDITPQEIAANDAAAAARSENAAKQEEIAGNIGKVQDEKVKALQDLQRSSDIHYAEIQKRAADLRDQIANGKIDPNHYWAEKGTGGRISASIGLLLSGLGAGLGHTENMAMQVIQKNIDRDIASQRENLETKKSLLADTYRETGDLRLAQQMTEHTLQNVALAQLNKFAAQSSSADVKQRAAVANAMGNEALAQKARQIADQRSANQAAAANANTQATNALELQKGKAGDALKTPREMQGAKIASMNSSLTKLDDHLKNLESGAQGPISGSAAVAFPWGGATTKANEAAAKLLRESIASSFGGGVASDARIAAAEASVPGPSDPPAVAREKIARLKRDLEIMRDEYIAQQGGVQFKVGPTQPVSKPSKPAGF